MFIFCSISFPMDWKLPDRARKGRGADGNRAGGLKRTVLKRSMTADPVSKTRTNFDDPDGRHPQKLSPATSRPTFRSTVPSIPIADAIRGIIVSRDDVHYGLSPGLISKPSYSTSRTPRNDYAELRSNIRSTSWHSARTRTLSAY